MYGGRNDLGNGAKQPRSSNPQSSSISQSTRRTNKKTNRNQNDNRNVKQQDNTSVPFQPMILKPAAPVLEPPKVEEIVKIAKPESSISLIQNPAHIARSTSPQTDNKVEENRSNSIVTESAKAVASESTEISQPKPSKPHKDDNRLPNVQNVAKNQPNAPRLLTPPVHNSPKVDPQQTVRSPSLPASPTKAPQPPKNIKKTSVFKLLNEQNQFQSLLNDDLKALLESETVQSQQNCIVIGVLGKPSVGKSTLLNAIYNRKKVLSNQMTSSGDNIQQQFVSLTEPFKVGPRTQKSDSSSFSIDMSIARLDGLDSARVEPNNPKATGTDNLLLLDVQSFPSAAAISYLKKNEVQVFGDAKSVEHMLHLSSLQIGVFLMSICNVLLVVDDTTCDVHTWSHLKTLEMLKWNIPELSEFFTATQQSPLSMIIPQFKANFANMRKAETYEMLMLNRRKGTDRLRASESKQSSNSVKSRTRRRGPKNGKQSKTKDDVQNTASDSTVFNTDLTNDEEQVHEIEGALDEANIYSTENEYIPSVLFVFNKLDQSSQSPQNKKLVSSALNRFFSNSRFNISDESSVELQEMASWSNSLNFNNPYSVSSLGPTSSRNLSNVTGIPFFMVSHFCSETSTSGPADATIEKLVNRVLSMNKPRFKKHLSPREWILASSRMWDFIKHSPVLSHYNDVLKRTVYSTQREVQS